MFLKVSRSLIGLENGSFSIKPMFFNQINGVGSSTCFRKFFSSSSNSTSNFKAPVNILLVGAPGSGKGTQAGLIQKDFGLSHIATGDILREEIRKGTEIGKKVEKIVAAGQLVSSEFLAEFTESYLAAHGNGWILDGFPRSLEQADLLDEVLGRLNYQFDALINLVVPHEIILERLSGRYIHEASGRLYHTTFTPPKVEGRDDITGDKLIRRSDDEPETVLARLEKHESTVSPLLERYASTHPGRVYHVHSETSKAAHAQIVPILNQILAAKGHQERSISVDVPHVV